MFRSLIVLLLSMLSLMATDFTRDLSPKLREEFMKINRENKDVTEKELMDKIGVWAKEKGMEKQWAVEHELKRKEKSSLLRHLENFEYGLVSTFNEIEGSMRDVKLTRQQIEMRVEKIFESRIGSAVVIRKIMEEHRRSFDFDRQLASKDDIKKHIIHFSSFSVAFLDVILKRTKRSVQKVPEMLAKLSASIRDESVTIDENGRKFEEMLESEKDDGAQLAVEMIFEMARMVANEERKREEKQMKKNEKPLKRNNQEL